MAKVTLICKTIKDPINLYLRFFFTEKKKRHDIFVKSNILVKKKWWSNKKQNFNAVSEAFPKETLKKQIDGIKDYTISEFTKSYSNGETIDKLWLEGVVQRFHNRPKTEGENFTIYYIPFLKRYIYESDERINLLSGINIKPKTIQKYEVTLKRLIEFEKKYNTRLKHSDINLSFHAKFVGYLKNELLYGSSTIEKFISQIKTFCREAESKGYKINPEFKSRKFTFKREKPIDTYLNLDEIDNVYNLQIEDERDENIRDFFIIGLWTGLRVSDFKQLDRLNIVGDDFVISETEKTGKPVIIPIHKQVKDILKKRGGKLPKVNIGEKSWEILFNKRVKEICKNSGITQEILGDKLGKVTNTKGETFHRNIRDIYPKYLLISSHTCRRSFVSNHYGELPNQTICAITGHASEKQLLDYVKITQDQHVEKVRKYWEEQNKTLKIVS